MTDGEGPSSSLLGKRPRLHEEADEERRKKRELLEEIAASLPQGLSKNQRKKQSRQLARERMKPEWKYVRVLERPLHSVGTLYTGGFKKKKKK